MSFQDLQLDPRILKALEAAGFSNPTDIQTKAIPVALEGKDVLASAQTGTGKTAAFALPALQRMLANEPKPGYGPRMLVLAPTRELATQVFDAVRNFSKFTRLRAGTVVGGVPYPPQIKMLRNGVDVLVATPGRLVDHMNSNRIDWSRLEFLVLDEADRMLDMGFKEDVDMIADAAPKDRQTMFFSATLEGDVLRVAQKMLRDPTRIQIAAVKEKHASITQKIHQADNLGHKHSLLEHLLNEPEVYQAIVFTATKRDADNLATDLIQKGHSAAALHGDMKQGARNRTVERMRRGYVKVLVATDVAARGIDISGISHVVNFDLPMVAEDYVHRIGRTGRGGATGTAASLVGPQDWDKLRKIERLTGQTLSRHVIEGLEPSHPEPRPGSGGRNSKGRGGRPGGRPGGGKPRFGGGNRSEGGYRSEGGRSEGGYRGNSEGRSQGGYRGNSEGGYRGNSEGRSQGGYRGNSEGGYRGNGEGRSQGGYRGNSEGGYRGNSEGGYRGTSEGRRSGGDNRLSLRGEGGGYRGREGGFRPEAGHRSEPARHRFEDGTGSRRTSNRGPHTKHRHGGE